MSRSPVARTLNGLSVFLAIAALPTVASAMPFEYEARAAVAGSTRDVDEAELGLRTGLSLRLRAPKLGAGLSAEALLALDLTESKEIWHRSPYLRLGWKASGWAEGEGLFVTVLPLSSARLHLGWEHPATWGRTMGFYDHSTGRIAAPSDRASATELPHDWSPAAELRLTRERWYGYVAGRGDSWLDYETRGSEWTWMALGGAGVEILPGLRIEVGGARADHGRPAITPRIRTGTDAIAGRLLFHRGEAIAPSFDYSFRQYEPEFFETGLDPERYPGGVSLYASLEATHLQQRLGDPDRFEKAKEQGEDVAALQLRAKVGFLRAHLLGLYRSATFPDSLREEPGAFIEGVALGEDDLARGALMARGGFDYHFSGPRLTPGVVVDVELPAVLGKEPSAGSRNSPAFVFAEDRLFIVRDSGLVTLPKGVERKLSFTAKATLRWDWRKFLSVAGELCWRHDPNSYEFGDYFDDEGLRAVMPAGQDAIGIAALLQVRL